MYHHTRTLIFTNNHLKILYKVIPMLTSSLSRLSLTLGLATIVTSLVGCSNPANTQQTNNAEGKEHKSVAITAIVEHPSLDAIREGVIDELAEQGYKAEENLTVNFQSAQGNMSTVGQISKQFVADSPDAIVPISTPSAQSVVASSKSIPIIYTAVSDPVAAKLVDANNKPTQANVTGLSSQLPLEPQLDLIQQIKPNAKVVGYVYSPGEANSVALKERLEQLLPVRGLELLDIPANRPTDIGMATRSLQGKADVIYTSMDNNVASAFEAMTLAANELDIPIIASDEFSVQRGATAALGVNDYDFGRSTGKMVAQVLNGTPVSEIKPAVMNDLTLFISPKHAEQQGVTLPANITKNAINTDDK